jgi:RNA polymerase sigma factor (sigma-70 family)
MNQSRATWQPDATQQQTATALEEVFAHCQDELLGTLYYLLGNAEDARDALQEAFLRCWRHRQGVPQIDNLRAWIFRVALNVGRDVRSAAWRRRRRPMDEDEQAMLTSRERPPEAEAARREQLTLLRRALHGLRPEEQEVFLLRQNGQMTYDEIAETINIPVGTVKTRMRLALAKLREALEGNG